MLVASVDSRSATLHLTAHRLARNITVWEETEPLPEGFISVPFEGPYASIKKNAVLSEGACTLAGDAKIYCIHGGHN